MIIEPPPGDWGGRTAVGAGPIRLARDDNASVANGDGSERLMTKDGQKESGDRGAEPLGREPSDAQRAASRAFGAQFERLREESDELLKLQRAAARVFATRPAAQFESLCGLFDTVLPRDADGHRRIARAVELDPTLLQRLRASRLDPLDAPPTPMTALSRAMTMDFATFWTLAQRDHQRFVGTANAATARAGNSVNADSALVAFRAAWERDERDDPPAGGAPAL